AAVAQEAWAPQPHPEIPVGVRGQPQDMGDREGGARRLGKGAEGQAVEAEQAAVGADPEMAVPGLADGEHGAARKAALDTPPRGHVLRERGGGVHGGGDAREPHREQGGQASPPAPTPEAAHGVYSNFSMTTSVPRGRETSPRRKA